MGPSMGALKRGVFGVLLLYFLLATSLQLLTSESVAASTTTVFKSSSSSWLRRQRYDDEGPSRRALLQAADQSANQFSLPHTVLSVDSTGNGDYETVQEAIDAVPEYNTQRVVIRIFSGTYREKIHIPSNKPFITIFGAGNFPPVLTWNDTAASAGSTWKSATVSIDADNFVARGIIFENTAPAPPPGAVGAQAIALRIGGDMAAFYSCSFLGAQDTLCDWMGRHYFQDCFIQGSIDFIFGNGQSLYEDCTINSIAQSSGSVTAQYRQTGDDPGGYSFVNCNIMGTGHIHLGRAWGPYSRVVFAMTTMTDVIDPKGWSDWGNTSNDQTVYYAEYNNFGEGANLTQRVSFSRALTQTEAQPFLSKEWINGTDWIPF